MKANGSLRPLPPPAGSSRLPPRQRETEGVEHPSVVPALRFILFTGVRKSEALELQWSWVYLDRGIVSFPDSKTGKKSIPISTPAREVLEGQERLSDNPYVFPGKKPGTHLIGLPYGAAGDDQGLSLSNCLAEDLRLLIGQADRVGTRTRVPAHPGNVLV